jgi:protein AroM
VVPILDRYVSAKVPRIHRGVLDGRTRGDIAARYQPDPGEPVLITRLQDGGPVELSRRRMREGVQDALAALEAEGCDIILLLCTFAGLECRKAWLVEPDHIIPSVVAGLVGGRQLGIIVPLAAQMASESEKWRPLARKPFFAAANPYGGDSAALLGAGRDLKARGADALLLDCIGFTESHRATLAPLALPVILSNAVVAKAVGELLEG